MALRFFYVGTTGPYYYDAVGAFRFETAAGTISLTPLSGQSTTSVDIGGGNINATVIGNNTAAAGNFTVLEAETSLEVSGGTSSLIVTSAGTSGATETGWVRVTIGGAAKFIRVFDTK